MKALRLGDIERFPFLDPPQPRAVADGYRVLEELGAIRDDGRLTTIGDQLGGCRSIRGSGRIDPRRPRRGRAARVGWIIAAVARPSRSARAPVALQQRADEAHRKFRDEASDFAGYLKLWSFWQDARANSSRRQVQKLCRDHFLSYPRMREVGGHHTISWCA